MCVLKERDLQAAHTSLLFNVIKIVTECIWNSVLIMPSYHIVLKHKAGNFLYFSYLQLISCAEPNQQWTDPTYLSIVCVSKAWYIVYSFTVP